MDFKSDRPIYRQIIEYAYTRILTADWIPGERIPSVRELAVQFAVNTHTILKAYEHLEAGGIIVSRRGMGFFLADDAPQRVNTERRREFFDNELTALFDRMDLLGISIDDIITHYNQNHPQTP